METSQRDYIADPSAQLAQEYAQLRILAAVARRGAVPLRVPEVIAYEAGVLITVAVTAPSMSTELLRGSQRPDELLSRVADTARHLQRALGTGHPALRTTLLNSPHSSIADTYARKFLSPRHTREYRIIEFARKPLHVADNTDTTVCAVDPTEQVAYDTDTGRTRLTLTATGSLGLCLAAARITRELIRAQHSGDGG